MISIEGYWADFFGIPPKALSEQGVTVTAHRWLGDYSGVWVFRHGRAVIVSVPEKWLHQFRSLWVDRNADNAEALVEERLGSALAAKVGPAFHGYSTSVSAVVSPPGTEVVRITRDKVGELKGSGDDRGWLDSGMDASKEAYFGLYLDGSLAAAGNYSLMMPGAAMVGFYTSPRYRNRGLGTAVLSAVFSHCLEHGLLVVFQTLQTNIGSIRAATKAGLRHYGDHVAYRLA